MNLLYEIYHDAENLLELEPEELVGIVSDQTPF
jgi:hypothetical protein